MTFAHRGAKAHAPENTLEAFALGLRLGATGLESDVWLTADGVAVLDHDGLIGGLGRKRSIASVPRSELPPHIPTLKDLYATCGTGFDLSLDVKDPAAAAPTVAVARAAGAADRLWLCHPEWELVATWRGPFPEVRLVDSTRVKAMRSGPERRAADLAAAGIDAVNLHHSDWNGGLITLFHRFERLCLAWDAQTERVLHDVIDRGTDGVFSDHVDVMTDVLGRWI